MNIKGQGHSVTMVQDSDSHFQTFFPLRKARFQVELPWNGGMKICSNGPGHMTNMAAMPIYGKNLKNLLLLNQTAMTLKVGMQHRVLKYYQVCPNDDLGLTLTYFTASSNLVPYAFVWEKGNIMDFSETIVVCDIKVGRLIELNEYMNLYEYQRSRSIIDLHPRSLRFTLTNFFCSETARPIEAKFHM